MLQKRRIASRERGEHSNLSGHGTGSVPEVRGSGVFQFSRVISSKQTTSSIAGKAAYTWGKNLFLYVESGIFLLGKGAFHEGETGGPGGTQKRGPVEPTCKFPYGERRGGGKPGWRFFQEKFRLQSWPAAGRGGGGRRCRNRKKGEKK